METLSSQFPEWKQCVSGEWKGRTPFKSGLWNMLMEFLISQPLALVPLNVVTLLWLLYTLVGRLLKVSALVSEESVLGLCVVTVVGSTPRLWWHVNRPWETPCTKLYGWPLHLQASEWENSVFTTSLGRIVLINQMINFHCISLIRSF